MGASTKTDVAIVFQGGGALGAYEAGAVSYIYERGMNPVMVCGVSIGAINAVVLAGAKGDPVEALRELWRRLTIFAPPFWSASAQRYLSLFGHPSFYTVRRDAFAFPSWTNFYDTSPLRRTLEDIIDLETLNDPNHMRVILTAVNVETGQSVRFANTDRKLSLDHVLASGSLPPGFPMTAIGNDFYWDGGLFDNTPLAPVIDNLKDGEENDLTIFVLDLFPSRSQLPSNMLEVFDRITGLIFQNKLHADVRIAQRISRFVDLLKEIETELPRDAAVRKSETYAKLMRYKSLRNLKMIPNEHVGLESASDFSGATLGDRFRRGYNAARAFCEQNL